MNVTYRRHPRRVIPTRAPVQWVQIDLLDVEGRVIRRINHRVNEGQTVMLGDFTYGPRVAQVTIVPYTGAPA